MDPRSKDDSDALVEGSARRTSTQGSGNAPTWTPAISQWGMPPRCRLWAGVAPLDACRKRSYLTRSGPAAEGVHRPVDALGHLLLSPRD
jgi:hypothetical protein